MITIQKANDRGHANYGWLDTYHSFSFASYFNPSRMGFRSLRVINDDRVAGGGGFDTHPHRDMEIITYVLSGALQHRDSMGNSAVMRAGDVQRISAGTGIQHSEFNHSPVEDVHLLQIWIMPDKKGAKPGYVERSFAQAATGQWHRIASKTGRDGSVPINQDAEVLLGKFQPGDQLAHELAPNRHAWVQVAEGEVTLNGQTLVAGDGAAVSAETKLELTGQKAAQVLLFDLN